MSDADGRNTSAGDDGQEQLAISEALFGRAVSRRSLLRGAGAGAALLAGGPLLAACSSGLKGNSQSSGKKITIGFVSPLTGDLAGFAVADQFIIDTIRKTPAFKNGVKIGSTKYDIDIVVKDSQSSTNRASQVAQELINQNNADMVLVTSTPEVTNPVASVCESLRTPCVSTVVPWESWYFGRGAKPGTTFQYTTTFFFGVPEFGECFIPMWNRIPNDRVVAGMFPNDADGNAFRQGWPPLVKPAGYRLVDGGAYPDGTTDYTSMITEFKQKKCDIFVNGPLPPDFNVMWKQAAQQGYKPKLATVAKVLLFPADLVALGPLATNIATDSWWTPTWPGKSSLDGMTPKQLADSFQSSVGKQWTQTLGSTYALFEVAYEAFKKASDPHDHAAVAAQLRAMNLPQTMDGPLNFTKGPVPGVAIVKPAGAQWQKGTGKFPFDFVIVDNSANKAVPLGGNLLPTNA
jgi:ABC-type branched-chain amino acid transport systems, periplasmic component